MPDTNPGLAPELVSASRTLATCFIERAKTLNLKGIKRDDEAVSFFCGAATMADMEGNKPLAEHLTRQIALIIAVRGYIGVQQIAGNLPG